MALPFVQGFSAARAHEPLPVGETGGSKGKGEGREGDHPDCTSERAEVRGYAAGGGPRPANPCAREGQRPLAFKRQMKAARRPRSRGREAPSSIRRRRRRAQRRTRRSAKRGNARDRRRLTACGAKRSNARGIKTGWPKPLAGSVRQRMRARFRRNAPLRAIYFIALSFFILRRPPS